MATSSGVVDLTGPRSLSAAAGAAISPPNPPATIAGTDRFIALAIRLVKIVPDAPTIIPATIITVLLSATPVAGRMPGHMNVLLAESQVPYDLLKEMDEVNPEFARTDVTLVIGANDVTNPAAKNEPGSPIYGMPILEVDKSGAVVVLKRSMASGFAGIDNPLFYEPETSLLFGDAKQSVSDITAAVQSL